MKNSIKKSIVACLLASLAVTAFGCSSGTEETASNAEANLPKETISLDQTKQELTFVHDIGGDTVVEATEAKENDAQNAETKTDGDSAETDASGSDAANDGTSADSSKATTAVTQTPVAMTETVAVTDTAGQPVTDAAGEVQTEVVNVTEAVQVTDASGEPVTDAEGQKQTEVVNVTEIPAAEPQENNHDTPAEATEAPQSNSYAPVYDICKAYWLDMSQEGDFFFNGEFLVIEFDVNEGTPDGHYPVTIAKTDIAGWDITSWKPECIDGEVAVNTTPEAQADMPESDFALKVNSVSAKPGETAKVVIDLANNPGFCGFVLDIQYDKNALTIAETSGGADFNKAIHYIAN